MALRQENKFQGQLRVSQEREKGGSHPVVVGEKLPQTRSTWGQATHREGPAGLTRHICTALCASPSTFPRSRSRP